MLRVLVIAFSLALAAVGAHADETPGRAAAPLDILLTNDDGFDAPGLLTLRAALQAAGHKVKVVAPATNRSGSSVAITSQGTLTWRETEPGVIAVDGTPADCVRVALNTLYANPPDLILSGINFGQNVGPGTLSSGTVGAAVTGASLGVASVAISQTVDPNDVRGTERYFPSSAAFAVRLVEALRAEGGGVDLPAGVALNVNHPPRVGADVAGVRLTRQGRSTLYSLVYERQGEAVVGMAFARNAERETVPEADTTALIEGYVSVTPLDGDWTLRAFAAQSAGADRALDKIRKLTRALDTAASEPPAAVER